MFLGANIIIKTFATKLVNRLFGYLTFVMQIYLTETQLAAIILEAMSVQDIHTKYYSDIDEQLFNAVVKADPTFDGQKMGRYTKWLLGLVRRGTLTQGDLGETKHLLDVFEKYKNRVEVKDVTRLKSIRELYDVVRPFMESNRATSKSDEKRKVKEGAEKVYEDNAWMVIIPHTEEAAKLYGKGTKWCTAADQNNMFDYFNEEGPLYININKYTGAKFQFHFESGQFKNAANEDIEMPVTDNMPMTPDLKKWYYETLDEEKFYRLIGFLSEKTLGGYVVIVDDRGYNIFDPKQFKLLFGMPAEYIDAKIIGTYTKEETGKDMDEYRYFRVNTRGDHYNLFDAKTHQFVLPKGTTWVSYEDNGWISFEIGEGRKKLFRIADQYIYPENVDDCCEVLCGFDEDRIWNGNECVHVPPVGEYRNSATD